MLSKWPKPTKSQLATGRKRMGSGGGWVWSSLHSLGEELSSTCLSPEVVTDWFAALVVSLW